MLAALLYGLLLVVAVLLLLGSLALLALGNRINGTRP